jgi:formylglycine-generating enzyme required for sulfatase activity
MIYVEGGSFIMGSDAVDRNPPHKVTLDDFYMAKYLVTVGEWKEFLADTGLAYDWDWQDPDMDFPFKEIVPTDDCPAQGLNWYYAVAYCNWLSERDGLKPSYTIKGEVFYSLAYEDGDLPVITWNKRANGYRLPTEAEWEYAARGGKLSKGYLYAGSNDPYEVGRYKQERSYPVGQMKPNELGLYDMTGDVEVWCWDWYDGDLSWLPEKNPSIDNTDDVRKLSDVGLQLKVLKGEIWRWVKVPRYVYHRNAYPPIHISWIGIRLVRNGR